MMTKLLLIGMPVYNGERFISQALESLISQTFTEWTLLISDNASTDNTQQICESFCARDSRIRYFRQPANIGAMNNFKYLLETADSEFFMWAAADDEWESSFIEACIKGLDAPGRDWAFTNMVNIDSFGHIIRRYPSFYPFSEGKRYLRVTKYVLTHEIYGKANLIYGIYRLQKVKKRLLDLLASPDAHVEGYDMIINLAVLCQANLFIDERILFRKRHVQFSDTPNLVQEMQVSWPILVATMASDFEAYRLATVKACQCTEFADLIKALMETRSIYQNEITTLSHALSKSGIERKRNILSKTLRFFMRRHSQ